jgi:small subunit ribosomal protein S8
MTDPIADMLLRINNAMLTRSEHVDIPFSKMKKRMAEIFCAEGYIRQVDILKRVNKEIIRLGLKYDEEKQGAIKGMRRISTPGRRIYAESGSIPRVQSGLGIALISTSQGIVTDKEARKRKIGGEVLCYVW